MEVWTRRGLQRFFVMFFIELSTRKVEIGGIASAANGLWMSQIARNPTDVSEGILTGKRYLLHDRDPLFTKEFLNMLAGVGVESVKLPPRSPNRKLTPSACPQHQGMLFGPADPVWRKLPADSCSEFRGPLSSRTQSSGIGQRNHSTGNGPRHEYRCHPPP